MGLTEKRKMKELIDVTFPERTRELLEITGSAIVYAVDWPTLADEYDALNFIDNISCHRINMALRTICVDQLGKDCIKDGLTTIKLANVNDVAAKSVKFTDGVLDIHCAYARGLDGGFSDNEIRKVLEAGL